MLIVGREVGQSVIIDNDIKVTVLQNDSRIKLVIDAPDHMLVSPIKQDPDKLQKLKKTDRKIGDTLLIGEHVKITMLQTHSGLLRIAIDAPKEISIFREEIYKKQAKGLINSSNF